MILHAGLSIAFWAEAVCNAAYVRNRVITSAHDVTPYEKWYGKKPDVSYLRVFGCTAYAHIPAESRKKFDQKTVKMRLAGHSSLQKGYRLYDEKRQKVFVRRDVIFNETDFGPSKIQVNAHAENDESEEEVETTEEVTVNQ